MSRPQRIFARFAPCFYLFLLAFTLFLDQGKSYLQGGSLQLSFLCYFGKRKLIPIKYANFIQYKDMMLLCLSLEEYILQRVLVEEGSPKWVTTWFAAKIARFRVKKRKIIFFFKRIFCGTNFCDCLILKHFVGLFFVKISPAKINFAKINPAKINPNRVRHFGAFWAPRSHYTDA